jgi:hypothetical protein
MCTDTGCNYTCDPGFSHCMSGDTGCETPTSADVQRCGACNTDCTVHVAHATGISCANSACGYTACASGFNDCNADHTDGCESDPQTDPAHCGDCETSCTPAVQNVMTVECKAGKCDYDVCAPFHDDCNGKRSDGCECSCGSNGAGCCSSGPACQSGLNCTGNRCK